MNKRILGVVLFALAGVTVAATASADACKGAKVIVKNDKSVAIKVTKIEYWDGCDNKPRTEDISLREIAAGGSTTITDTLEYVGNCPITKFRLYRAVRQGTGSAYSSYDWGGWLVPDGGTKTCNSGVTYTVHAYDNQ